jgi:1-acyl-sn-glycerol-3-phosphate acyltransferase
MLVLRSITFNVLFYLTLALLMIGGLPTIAGGRKSVHRVTRAWSTLSLKLLKHVCGVDIEFRGVENIPPGGCIVASKHQSALETFALTQHVGDCAFILKKELALIPLFGLYLKATEQIAIDRSSGRAALQQAVHDAKRVLAQGRKLIIFPEGTRTQPYAEPNYKLGVVQIYTATGATCVPVALNTGLFWPRRSFLRRSGKIVIEFLEPIPPGLDKKSFFAILQERIESASTRLVDEALALDPTLTLAIEKAPAS